MSLHQSVHHSIMACEKTFPFQRVQNSDGLLHALHSWNIAPEHVPFQARRAAFPIKGGFYVEVSALPRLENI